MKRGAPAGDDEDCPYRLIDGQIYPRPAGRGGNLLVTPTLQSNVRNRVDVKARELLDKERDKREEALKQQLEALRAIERGILEREEKLRRNKK